jgi:ankyrin repeat protein
MDIFEAIDFRQKWAVERCIAEGADVNAKNYKDETPLHVAANSCSNSGGFEILKYLISKGAEINTKDGDGHTPLWYAIVRACCSPDSTSAFEAMKYLVSKGAFTYTICAAGPKEAMIENFILEAGALREESYQPKTSSGSSSGDSNSGGGLCGCLIVVALVFIVIMIIMKSCESSGSNSKSYNKLEEKKTACQETERKIVADSIVAAQMLSR